VFLRPGGFKVGIGQSNGHNEEFYSGALG
jgi:hypothetical protein